MVVDRGGYPGGECPTSANTAVHGLASKCRVNLVRKLNVRWRGNGRL